MNSDKRSKHKLTTTQNKRFTDNIAPPHKETLNTAKYSVLRGWIPGYHLACEKSSKISDRSQPFHIRHRLNRHDESDGVDFVVSENLTTARNGHHTHHTFMEIRANSKNIALQNSISSSKISKLSLSTVFTRIHALYCIKHKTNPTINTEAIDIPFTTSPSSWPIEKQCPAIASLKLKSVVNIPTSCYVNFLRKEIYKVSLLTLQNWKYLNSPALESQTWTTPLPVKRPSIIQLFISWRVISYEAKIDFLYYIVTFFSSAYRRC